MDYIINHSFHSTANPPQNTKNNTGNLLDEKNMDTKALLESIQKNLDFEKVNEIYIKLSNKKLQNNTKEIMVGYFTTNKNNTNPSSLIYIIKNCINLRKDIFSKINKYAINELDFLSLKGYRIFILSSPLLITSPALRYIILVL